MSANADKLAVTNSRNFWFRLKCALLGCELDERRIGLTAAGVLLMVAFGTGAVILWQAIKNTQNYLEKGADQTVRDRASIVMQSLSHASEVGASMATSRIHLKTVLGRIMDNKATPMDYADLARILDNIAKRSNIHAIELRDSQGKVLGKRGEFLLNSKLNATTKLPYPASLLWNQRFYLDQRVPILEGGRKLGEGRVQLTLVDIDQLFLHQEVLGETGEFMLCGNRTALEMTCFPSRWAPDGNAQGSRFNAGKPLPMHYALEGKTGTVLTVGERHQAVVAAYGAVGNSGLGMVMQRDRAEFLNLSQRSFTSALPLLLFLSAGGVWLLRWRLAPVVRNIMESRARLKALIDSAPDAITSLDEHGNLLSFNPAAVTLFGYQPDEVVGRHISLLVPAVSHGANTLLLEAGEAHGKHKNGVLFPMEISIAQAANDAGAHYVVTLRDITARWQAEEALDKHYAETSSLNVLLKDTQNQLLQSEKMASVGQLAAGVAHEINNPIGYVYSNLSTLETYTQDLVRLVSVYEAAESSITDTDVMEKIRVAKVAADIQFLRTDMRALMDETREGIGRVKKIVQDLKDFSRIDNSDVWHWANLHQGLDTTLNIIWNELKYKAEVRKEYADIPEVECYPSQLNQVFMNLLVNAGHAIEDKGVITIRTGQAGEQVWIEIEDSGQGIDAQNLKRIFDPFFTTKPIGEGTGLGLSLSYSIVKKHGGLLEVESVVGQGTKFRVTLPIQQSKTVDAAVVER